MAGSVLVTGGARRIGLAICEELSARGWRVLAHSPDPHNPLCADFTRPDAADRLFAAAVAQAPDLCAIVNNAAVFSTAAELPPAEGAALWAVNVTVPVRLTELLAARLAERHAAGAVVNLLDTRILKDLNGIKDLKATKDLKGIKDLEGIKDLKDLNDLKTTKVSSAPKSFAPYVASKLALARATVAQARSLAPVLRVNGVAPGPVLPPPDAANREKGGPILLPRRPTPGDVAAAVAFLLDAETVTGQILAVDSGQHILHDA